MKKIFTLLFFMFCVSGIGVCSFSSFSSASSCALSKENKKIYDAGFQDARDGKTADGKYEDNDAYADGYSAGVKSVMVPDELV